MRQKRNGYGGGVHLLRFLLSFRQASFSGQPPHASLLSVKTLYMRFEA